MKVIVVFLLCIYVVIAEKRLTEISKAKRYDGKVENPVNNQNRIAKKRLDEVQKAIRGNERYLRFKTRRQVDLVKRGLELTKMILKEGNTLDIDNANQIKQVKKEKEALDIIRQLKTRMGHQIDPRMNTQGECANSMNFMMAVGKMSRHLATTRFRRSTYFFPPLNIEELLAKVSIECDAQLGTLDEVSALEEEDGQDLQKCMKIIMTGTCIAKAFGDNEEV